jgi:NAD/NADP transhydrogenase alpha subunit
MLIGVPLETAAEESRVAVRSEIAKKLRSQGHQLFVQSGAGEAASRHPELMHSVVSHVDLHFTAPFFPQCFTGPHVTAVRQ